MKKILTVAFCMVLALAFIAQAKQGEKKMNRTTLKVQNLSCGSCLSNINSKLEVLEGYSGMGANLLEGIVAVDYIEPLTEKEISLAITEIGYPAKVISVESIDESESYASSSKRSYGGSCCGPTPEQYKSSADSGSTQEKSRLNVTVPPKNVYSSSSCCSTGNQSYKYKTPRGCYATGDTWKKLMQKYFNKDKQTNKPMEQ